MIFRVRGLFYFDFLSESRSGWSSYWNMVLMSPLTRARNRGTPAGHSWVISRERGGEQMLLTETGGDQVEEGGLGVFVDVHHEDGQEEAGQVGCSTTTVLFSSLSPDM